MSAELAIAAALIAVAGAVWFWLPWFRANLNHTMFADMIIKLVKADNLDRARKLTMAAPSNPFATGVRAALAAAAERGDPRAAFDEAIRPEIARLSRGFAFALASLIASAMAVVMVVEDAPPFLLLGPAVACGLLAHAYRIARTLARAGTIEADRVFGALAERATN